MRTFANLVAALAVLPSAVLAADKAEPPRARVDAVVDTYFGEKVSDPYRWMEVRGPEFETWAKAQDSVTRQELTALPGYAAFAREVAALSASTEVASSITRSSDLLFFEKRPAGTTQLRLFVKPFGGGAERLLVDPEAPPVGTPGGAITEYAASPDGHFVTVGLTSGGSEDATLRILDVRTGTFLPEAIDRARFAGAEWDPAGDVFYYTRLNPFPAGAPEADRFRDQVIYRHVLRSDPSTDKPVFKVNDQKAAYGRDSLPFLLIPQGSRYAFTLINSGVSPENEWFMTPVAALARPEKIVWTKIAGLDAKLTLGPNADSRPVVIGDDLYATSFKDAPNYRLMKLDLSNPGKPPAPVVAERDAVLSHVAAARDGIYLVYAGGGVHSLNRFAPVTGRVDTLKTPFEGAIAGVTANPDKDGVIYSLASWTQPNLIYTSSRALVSSELPLAKPFPRDLTAYASERIIARAGDGTAIPVSVVYRRDVKRDGSAAALVEAYGAYGFPQDPGFSPRYLAWLDRGGIYAMVHVRGGGEFGERWHLAGKGANKPNTWRDYIAGVDALVAGKWTSPARIVGIGTSAGGIMISRAVTERPDLLRAAIMNVPIVDTLRNETSEGGPANTAEFGSVVTEEGYRALREMSGYAHVINGTRYPATLVTAGMNDRRVPAWQGAKMAARLQAAVPANSPPIRLRVDFAGGHGGIASTKAQFDGLMTDVMAFALQATGDPAFAPNR